MKKFFSIVLPLVLLAGLAVLLLWPEPATSNDPAAGRSSQENALRESPSVLESPAETVLESRSAAPLSEPVSADTAAALFDREAVYGLIVDQAGGKPVSGAKIYLFESGWTEPGAAPPKPMQETTSDAGGRFKISGLKPCRYFRILTEAAGFALSVTHWAMSGKEAKIYLNAEARLAGEIRDAQSRTALAGAKISYSYAGIREIETRSGEDGRFRLSLPAREQIAVSVSLDGYARQRVNLSSPAGETKDRDFALRKTAETLGEVYDAETNQPIAGAEIGDWAGMNVRSDAQGRFRLQPVETTNQFLLAHAPGYCSLRFELKQNQEGDLRLGLVRGVSIEGVVRDRQGKPVAGASVQAELQPEEEGEEHAAPNPIGGRSGVSFASGGRMTTGGFGKRKPSKAGWPEDSKFARQQVTDAEGRFLLEGLLPSSQRFQVTATHPDFCAGSKRDLQLTESGQRVFASIELARGGKVEGLVAVGDKPAAAKVWIRSDSNWLEGGTNDAGEYLFEHVAEGAYKLGASPEGIDDWSEDLKGKDLQVLEGGIHRMDLTLDATVTRPLAGRVLSPEGKPIANARLNAWANTADGRFVNREGRSLADGSFRLEIPDAGDALFQISAWDGGNWASQSKVPAGSESVEIRFPPQGKLRLRVLDARSGEPVSNFQVYLRETTGKRNQSLSLSSDGNGIAESNFALGIYDLTISAQPAGYRNAQLQGIEISQKPSDPIRVEMLAGVKVTIRLSAAEGALPFEGEGPWIHLLPTSGSKPQPRMVFGNLGGMLDESGQCTVTGVTPGKYRANLNLSGGAIEPAEFVVEDREAVTIELSWKPNKKEE